LGDDKLYFTWENSDKVVVDSNGNVGIGTTNGIGTTSPSRKLHIQDPNHTYVLVEATGANNRATLRLENGNDGRWDIQNLGDDKLYFTWENSDKVVVDSNGNVGIGTITPNYKLDVAGDINTTGDVRKNGTAYNHPDYVFEPGYELMPLKELKGYITENQHLPNMPSTEEVRKEGIKIFEQNRLLLEKLEEAYLYIIELEERIATLEETASTNYTVGQ